MFLLGTFCYTDGSCRTNQSAEVTAYTFAAHKAWLTGVVVKDDRLVTTIVAGNLTSATTNTESFVEFRINNSVTIQMVGLQELWQLLAHK